ncbi:MAG: hypothetical protein N3G80_00970 [Candidatus Micrarchaeota archaeon]|nr:hypothetical protein [Candidatus Micrarchaeota archaeon]
MFSFQKKISLVHQIDARAKLAFVLLIISLQIILPLEYSIFFFALTAFLFHLSSISLAGFIRKNYFLLFLPLAPSLVRLFFEKGTISIFGVFFPKAIYASFLNFLFLFSLVFIPLLFSLTTPPSKISEALRFFGLSKRLSFAFSLAFLSIPFFLRKLRKSIIAQKCRGCSYHIFGLLLPLLHACFKKAKKLSLSLAARGFDASSL